MDLEPTGLSGLLGRDAIIGLLWGSGGGAMVAIVTRTTIGEMLGRLAVGGLVAAAGAPYLAEQMNMDTTSSTYPFVCCSLGILGYQLVKAAVEQPERIPIIGALLAKAATPGAQTMQAPAAPSLPVAPVKPPAPLEWATTLQRIDEPTIPKRVVRVPLL